MFVFLKAIFKTKYVLFNVFRILAEFADQNFVFNEFYNNKDLETLQLISMLLNLKVKLTFLCKRTLGRRSIDDCDQV